MGQQLDKPARIATAASEGQVKHVKRSVSSAGSIDIRNEDGKSALMLAVEHHHVLAVRTLLEAGADVNTKELSHTTRRSVLMLAIEEGASECVKVLIQSGADVNGVDSNGETGLMYAVKKDNLDCLQALIKARANLNQVDSFGTTALMLAVKAGHPRCVELLLQAGADPNIADSTGQTCVMHSVKEGNPQGIKCLQMLLQPRQNVKVNTDLGDSNGMTGLMHCIRNGNLECLRELLCGKANPDIKDSLGRTVLMLASQPQVMNISEGLQCEFVNALIDAGANMNIRDYDGKTALMHAIEENLQAPAANILRARGANVNIPDKLGMTVLMLAVKRILDNVVFLKFLHELLENEVNLDVVDKWGKTALIHTLELKDSVHEKAVLLLQMGANPHTGRHQMIKCSPLLSCALRKNFEKGAHERIAFSKFFIASGFMIDFDVKYRIENIFQDDLDEEVRSLLLQLHSNPWPLSRLALIAVSSAIGPNPGREKRVKKTNLPQRIQNLLLYQDPISQLPRHHWESIPLCFNPTEYENLPKPRPLLQYWPFGRDIVKCYCKKCQGRGLNFHAI